MKMRYGLAVIGIAAAANVSGCADSTPETPHNPAVEKVFNEVTQLWNDRGFSLLGKTKLVTIGANELFKCKSEEIYTTRDVASYCPPENTIAISLDSYDRLVKKAENQSEDKRVEAEDVARFIVAHEAGHGLQHNNQKLKVDDPGVEYEADCTGAIAMKKLYPDSATKENARNFYSLLNQGDGSTHGTIEGRIHAYNTGLEKGACPSPFPID